MQDSTQASRSAPVTIRQALDTDAKAVLALLESEHHLEVAYDPAQFLVAETTGKIVACARMKRLTKDRWEIASVVVTQSVRRHGIGAKIVKEALRDARGIVYALALAPDFFTAQGFRPIPAVPDLVVGKATSVCASADFVPMELRL